MASLAREGVIRRIKGKGTFISEGAVLRRKRSLRIGLCFPSHYFSQSMAVFSAFGLLPHHAKNILQSNGHEALVFSFQDIHEEDFDRHTGIDALLISMASLDNDTIPVLKRKKYPIAVIMQTGMERIPFHQVIPDLLNGFYHAAKCLREKGIDFVQILLSDEATLVARSELFHRAALWAGFEEKGIAFVSIPEIRGDLGQLTGYRLAEHHLLRNFRRGSAYFVPGDFFAFGVLSAFLEQKLIPGKDFYLISFDNLEGEEFYPFGIPLLTSVDFPKRKVVESAIALLEEEIRKPSAEVRTLQLPCELILRETFKN